MTVEYVMGLILRAYPELITFSKLSRGGRVCEAGSRGPGEMLQHLGGVGEVGKGRPGKARMDILPKIIPRSPNLNLT